MKNWLCVVAFAAIGACGDGDVAPDASPVYGDAGAADGSIGTGGADAAPSDAGTGTTDGAPLFDLDLIRDPATADCTFANHRTTLKNGVSVDLWDISYLSWEQIDGDLQPIRIRGYASKPQASSSGVPGVVQAHGLGGYATEDSATGPASLIGAVVLAYTGPGGGTVAANTSEGRPAGFDSNYRMFDTTIDARGSWFWGHTVAGLRGLTCLAARPEVDAGRLGMTGFSAGGVATLIGAAVDDRIIAAVPLSASLAWDVAVQSPNAWQHSLLETAGLTIASPEWTRLIDDIVAANALLPDTSGAVFMVNGSSDEFFPLTAHLTSYDAIPATKRTSIVGNFDHGCYVTFGGAIADDIAARADLQATGAQRAWFRHRFGTDATYATIPSEPELSLSPVGGGATSVVATPSTVVGMSIDDVRFWWSGDGGVVFGDNQLDPLGGDLYGAVLAIPDPATLVYYVDVRYSAGGEQFSVSSRPVYPAGFVPSIRTTTCGP